MPKPGRRHKRGGSAFPRTKVSKPFHAADSVKDVLARGTPNLTRFSDQASRQRDWLQWLAKHLPADLTAHLSGVVEREGTLVIFAESAAWSARLRYAVLELEAPLRTFQPAIQHVDIKVLPRT
jgi:hypothetical protein